MNYQTPVPYEITLQAPVSLTDGSLRVAEYGKELPFKVKRQYIIQSESDPRLGGAHAHRSLWQLFVCVRGSLKLTLEGQGGHFSFTLTDSSKGVVVPPGYWRDYQITSSACVSVLASQNYDEADYIRDYKKFQTYLSRPVASVPLTALDRENAFFKERIESSLEQCLNSNDWVLGGSVQVFEEAFASYCNTKYAIGCGNGLDALSLVLKAWGIGPNDEVIVPTHSFIASALAISNVGAKPVFVDSLPCSSQLDVSQIEAAVNKHTKAIIPVHLYGVPVDMDAVMAVAKRHGLWVLEDAAQAHGALYKSQKVGSLGHAAAFSFYPTKNLGALGDGGCVVTNDEQLAHRVRSLANYGGEKKYHHTYQGVNSRLDTFQAAVLTQKLTFLDQANQIRQALAGLYLEQLSKLPGLKMLNVPLDRKAVWHLFPIFLSEPQKRDRLAAYLNQKQVGTGIHYPIAIHAAKAYSSLGYLDKDFPGACYNAGAELSLPLHPFLTQAEICHVSHLIKGHYE